MIIIGILGYGTMGRIRYNTLKEMNDVKVKSIFEISENVDEIKSLLVSSPEDIFNDTEINTIIISTPNKFNYLYTKTALLSGKNVFCEKPPSFTSNEVLELIEIEKKSNLKLMYGFNHRHHKSIQKIKEIIDSKEFGDLIWMRGRYGKSVDEDFFQNWRADPKQVGGGILMDQGIHMLDLFLYFKSDLKPHSALVTNFYWQKELEDNVFANFKSETGNVIASLHSTMTQWRHLFSLEIFLEQGYLTLNGLITSSMSYGKETLTIAKNRSKAPRATWNDEENILFESDDFWKTELAFFINSIKLNNKITFCNSQDAYNVMASIEEIYRIGKIF